MSGIQMALLGTGSAALDIQTVTVGGTGTILNRIRGYTSGLGSIVDGTSNIYGGATVVTILYDENGLGDAQYYKLSISGATNSGWTTLTIGAKPLNRVDATFATGNWTWPTADILTNQAFGAIGSVVVCTFT